MTTAAIDQYSAVLSIINGFSGVKYIQFLERLMDSSRTNEKLRHRAFTPAPLSSVLLDLCEEGFLRKDYDVYVVTSSGKFFLGSSEAEVVVEDPRKSYGPGETPVNLAELFTSEIDRILEVKG